MPPAAHSVCGSCRPCRSAIEDRPDQRVAEAAHAVGCRRGPGSPMWVPGNRRPPGNRRSVPSRRTSGCRRRRPRCDGRVRRHAARADVVGARVAVDRLVVVVDDGGDDAAHAHVLVAVAHGRVASPCRRRCWWSRKGRAVQLRLLARGVRPAVGSTRHWTHAGAVALPLHLDAVALIARIVRRGRQVLHDTVAALVDRAVVAVDGHVGVVGRGNVDAVAVADPDFWQSPAVWLALSRGVPLAVGVVTHWPATLHVNVWQNVVVPQWLCCVHTHAGAGAVAAGAAVLVAGRVDVHRRVGRRAGRAQVVRAGRCRRPAGRCRRWPPPPRRPCRSSSCSRRRSGRATAVPSVDVG